MEAVVSKNILIEHPMILKEFRDFLPKLDEIEFNILEQNCLQNGILNDIIVWRGYLIDGHNRLSIAKKHKLRYKVKNLPSTMTKDQVLAWLVEHQLGRRNCSAFTKIAISLKFEDYFKAKAKENQKVGLGRGKKGRHPGRHPFEPIDTLSKIGELAGVKRNAVSQVKYILNHASTETITKLHNGDLNIRAGYLKAGDKVRRERRLNTIKTNIEYENPSNKDYINNIICGDCNKIMPKMMKAGFKDKITCIICSPPYNNNAVDYGNGFKDNLPHTKYIDWLAKTFVTASQLLRDGGRLIVNVGCMKNWQEPDKGDSYKNMTNVDLIRKMAELDCGLKFRDEIIWHKHNGIKVHTSHGSWCSPSNPVIKTAHEYILIWSKNQWQLPNIENTEPDMNSSEFQKAITSVWQVSSITHKSPHPATFPEKLIIPIIKMYSYPGDIILDPFNGSGTTTVCAAQLGRQWIGIEQNPAFCDYAKKRTKECISTVYS